MKRSKQRGPDRMNENLSFRANIRHRQFLEKFAKKENCGLGEAARRIIENAMVEAGAEI